MTPYQQYASDLFRSATAHMQPHRSPPTGSVVGAIASPLIGAVQGAIGMSVNQVSNAVQRLALPPLGEMIGLWHRGLITPKNLNELSWGHGVPMDILKVDGVTQRERVWQDVVTFSRPRINPLTARDWHRKLKLGADAFSGGSGEQPDIDYAELVYLCKKGGLVKLSDINGFLNDFELLPVAALAQLWLRGVITEGQLRTMMECHGLTRPQEQDYVIHLTRRIPSPGEIGSYSVWPGFGLDRIKKLGLDAERPAESLQYAHQSGEDWPLTVTDPATGIGRETNLGELGWESHWQTLPPGMAIEAFRRIRPDNIAEIKREFPNAEPFTREDLEVWLKTANIPPGLRHIYQILAYRPLMKRDLQRLLQAGTMTPAELRSAFLSMGFAPWQADKEVQALLRLERVRKGKLLRKTSESQIVQALALGAISDGDAAVRLYELTLEDPKDLDAFRAQPPDAQVADAKANPDVRRIISTVKLDLALSRLKEGQALQKHLFLSGITDRNQAGLNLQALGMQQARIDDLILEWVSLRKQDYKEASAQKILSWGKQGLLSINDVYTRLQNLNYNPSDIPYMIAEAQLALSLKQAREAKAEATTLARQQAAAKAALRAADQARRRAMADLARHGSPGKIAKWFKDGLLTEAVAIRRLERLGWPQADAILLLQDATYKPPHQPKPPKKKGG